jgi:type I restriction enzyme S subunit
MITTLSQLDMLPEHFAIVRAILYTHVPNHEVWAFGSRVTGSAKEFSDLDLVVIGEKPLALGVHASLVDDFSESDLPYKVDVIDWATTDAVFRQKIQRNCIVVQHAVRNTQ